MILGIDISTSITGFCVFDDLGNPIEISHVNLKKAGSFFDKVKEVKAHLGKLMKKHSFKSVVVEESMQAFSSGASSAKTLFTLAKFNGIVQWLCLEQFGIEAESLNVSTARKHAGIKIDRKSKKNTKEQVLEQVMAISPSTFVWPERALKSGPRKGVIVKEACCFDMADAYVIAKAYCAMKK